MKEYKIFCDESNHLAYKDNISLGSKTMVLGAISAPSQELEHINRHIKYLKHKHKHNKELKWTKLHLKQMLFYDELLEFFFSNIHLRFQALLIPDKRELRHDIYNENNADLFYYKMYYQVLNNLLEIDTKVKIYLDYKDSRCGDRMSELQKVLHNRFKNSIDIQIFTIQSDESGIVQLTDLLIGAIAYKARDDIEHTSKMKNHIVNKLESLSGVALEMGTPPWENKFNIFKIQLGKSRK